MDACHYHCSAHAGTMTGTIVTGLIVGLVIDPQTARLQIVSVSAIAMAVKAFVRMTGRQVFNPAAQGLRRRYRPSWSGTASCRTS